MSVDYDVPFFSNTPDETHCYQACFKMVLKYFQPKKDYSWEQLDRITSKQKDKWTWSMAGLCWLAENGFDVINIETFNYSRFIKEKEAYFIEFYGKEAAGVSMENSIFEKEYRWAQKLLDTIRNDVRLPEYKDVEKYLDDGWILIANVNSRSLYNMPGYTGHFVTIKGYYEKGLVFHDPSLPGKPNVHMSYEDFNKGWDFPSKNSRNLICIVTSKHKQL